MGKKAVEENTRKAYVEASGSIAAMMDASGAGSPLFVINLCASIAPIDPSGRNMPGLENYRLYQVARVEDGRTRHRLRLGFFTSESHAQSVLAVVRQQYPTAFSTSLCDEDKRFARGYLPGAVPAPNRPMAVVGNAPAAQAKASAPAAKQLAANTGATAPNVKPTAPTASARPAAAKTLARAEPEVIELTWEPEPTAKTAAVAANIAPAAKPSALPSHPAAEITRDSSKVHAAPPTPAMAASTSDTARRPIIGSLSTSEPARASKSAPASSKADTSASVRVPALTLSDPPPPRVEKPTNKSSEPFHVGRGVQIADAGITLHADTPAPPAKLTAPAAPAREPTAKKAAPKSIPAKPAAPVRAMSQKPQTAASKPAAPALPSTAPLLAKNPGHNPMAALPELDSTQTIRALTSAELNDDQQEKWFCVQLAMSEQPVNLDTMPRLDIFEAYCLYSVATAGSGKIVHSLRLGFFKEAVSAEAVSGYLKTFFSSPTVMRVSMAEHARFKDRPLRKSEPRREAQVVELNNARSTRPVVPTITMEVAPPADTSATGSFKPHATGAFRIDASGTHQALGSAAKAAAKSAPPAIRRSAPTDATGRHKALPVRKSLEQQLLEEARDIELSESAIRKLPKNHSLLSRLVGKLTK